MHLQRGQVSLCSHKKCAIKTMYVQFCDEAKSCTFWLVNETLWHETETRPRRRDRDYIPALHYLLNFRVFYINAFISSPRILFSYFVIRPCV